MGFLLLSLGELVHAEDFLEGGVGGDVGPPGAEGGGDDQVGVGEVGEVGESEGVAGQVLALGKVRLVDVQHLLQLRHLLRRHLVVGLQPEHGHEHQLGHDLGRRGVEVLRLHLPLLVHQRPLLRRLAQERRPLPLELLRQIPHNRSRLCTP